MNRLDALADLIKAAKTAGADAADALLIASTSLSVERRLGTIEKLERSESLDLGLRVFVGKRQAIVASTEPNPKGFAALAERAVAMARVVPEDPFAGLPEAVAIPVRALDLEDPSEPTAEALLARAALAEEAALAIRGVTNSQGAGTGWGRTEFAMVASNGFAGHYARTSHGISAAAVAGEGTGMERDYDFWQSVHLADLPDPALVGRVAGEKAVRRLNPVRPKTARIPVVLDPRVSASMLGHLVGAINGAAV
ncbi:MAG: TldD/PmbA family protein, partial [Roseomonas sp.]|nr:TldD/PmbA family protein [Roseomonas sp.]